MHTGGRRTFWAAIALAVPPLMLAGPAAAAGLGERPSGVRLLMTMAATGRTTTGEGPALTYKVRVHARGGIAQDVTLRMAAEWPLSWTTFSSSCAKAAPDVLRCALGDVGEKAVERTATVQLPPGTGAGSGSEGLRMPLSVLAVADAANTDTRSIRAVIDQPGAPEPGTDVQQCREVSEPRPCDAGTPSGPEPSPSGHSGEPGGGASGPETHAGGGGETCEGGRPCQAGTPSGGKPKASGNPRPGESPKSGATPKSGGSPKTSGSPKSGGSPKASGSPKSGATPKTSGSPTSGATPKAGGKPTSGGTPKASGDPKADGDPKASANPKAGGKPEAGESPKSGGTPKAHGNPKAGGHPKQGADPKADGHPKAGGHPKVSGKPKGGEPEAGAAKPGKRPGAGGAPTGRPSAGGAVKPRTAGEPRGPGTPHAGPETSFGGDGCRPGDECGAFPMPPGGAGGVGPGAGPEAPGAPEPLLPELPAGAPSVPAPTAPGPGEIPLPPPLTAPEQAGPARAGEGRMTLMSPTAMSEQDETDWAIVVGVALVAEIGLLWGIACVGLWRRRVTLYRAAAAEPEGALT